MPFILLIRTRLFDMLFNVNSDQIARLDAGQLVQLLRRLLHAEAQAAGVSLNSLTVPLQITVADGGEDGRIRWSGGAPHTDYLPSRFCIFQSKATSLGVAGWKKECWTKSSQKGRQRRILSTALTTLIADSGSYVGFTTETLSTVKRASYVAAIEAGIRDAGGDPTALDGIEVYGTNEIAAWSEHHPAVALWLAEQGRREILSGFQSVESWGARKDFEAPYVPEAFARFAIGESAGANLIDAVALRERISDYVTTPGRSVRLAGPSGLGKSRFVFHILSEVGAVRDAILGLTAIFADFRVVGGLVHTLAAELSQSAVATLLIVDECPRDVAISLAQAASVTGSLCRIITIDIDDRHMESALSVTIYKGNSDLVAGILKNIAPGIGRDKTDLITELSDGFPKFAVLATSDGTGVTAFHTMGDIVERILKGARVQEDAAVRAVEAISLFDGVAFEGRHAGELDEVAAALVRVGGDEAYEHLALATQHDLVQRQRSHFSAQPLPVANYLAIRRLALIRPVTFVDFLHRASLSLLRSTLRRWKYFDSSPTMLDVAESILVHGEKFSDAEFTLGERGAALLSALVHISPDRVADTVRHYLLTIDLEILQKHTDGRRDLVEAMSRLVFRGRSFATAARMLLRLAAAENQGASNNATSAFVQLFHFQLSGTTASPNQRFAILDEGLESTDERVIAVCFRALDAVFDTNFMRFSGSERVGSQILTDWQPSDGGDLDEFLKAGLTRLVSFRAKRPDLAPEVDNIIASSARRLLRSNIYRFYGDIVSQISTELRAWPDAIKGVGDWLYFDRINDDSERNQYITDLYKAIMPTDIIELAVLYTKYWPSDIRDPETIYRNDPSDYGYSERMARKIAREIAKDQVVALDAIRRLSSLQLYGSAPFGDELAMRIADPKSIFVAAIDMVTENSRPLIRGLLSGIDRVSHALADECIAIARQRPDLPASLVELLGAVKIGSGRLAGAIDGIRDGSVTPSQAVNLSYGRGLDDLAPDDLRPLLNELGKRGSEGVWAALEIALMYRYGLAPLPEELFGDVEALLTSPDLLGGDDRGGRDSHLVESLFGRVRSRVGTSPEFTSGLIDQIERLTQLDRYLVDSTFKDNFRTVVASLVESAPLTLWERVSRIWETGTPNERGRLRELVGYDAESFDNKPQIAAGPMNGIAMNVIRDWIEAQPARRAAFPIDFVPALRSSDDEDQSWSDEIEDLFERYGQYPALRDALASRMRPRSWSGTIVPLLEVYLTPLKSWFNHPKPAVAAWAHEQFDYLERRIDGERSGD